MSLATRCISPARHACASLESLSSKLNVFDKYRHAFAYARRAVETLPEGTILTIHLNKLRYTFELDQWSTA